MLPQWGYKQVSMVAKMHQSTHFLNHSRVQGEWHSYQPPLWHWGFLPPNGIKWGRPEASFTKFLNTSLLMELVTVFHSQTWRQLQKLSFPLLAAFHSPRLFLWVCMVAHCSVPVSSKRWALLDCRCKCQTQTVIWGSHPFAVQPVLAFAS